MRIGRREARNLAFQTLFELESRRGRLLDEVLEDRISSLAEDLGAEVDTRSAEFAARLARETLARRADLDARIQEAAPAFPVDQLPSTDRVVLELATYELLYEPDVSVGVIINEAVELAKRYGGENSGRFVNGVLGTIAEALSARGGATPGGVSSRDHREDTGRR